MNAVFASCDNPISMLSLFFGSRTAATFELLFGGSDYIGPAASSSSIVARSFGFHPSFCRSGPLFITPKPDISARVLYMPRMAIQPFILSSPTELLEGDAPEVAELYARCADYFLLQDGVAPTLADARELFTDVPSEKEPSDQTVLGWRDEDALCAVAAILSDYPQEDTWYLGFMVVDALKRGRGVGRSIYTTIENWAVERGAAEIRLAVLEANEAGDRFWRSLGFTEIRRVGPDTFKERSHRRVELSRRLSGAPVASGIQ